MDRPCVPDGAAPLVAAVSEPWPDAPSMPRLCADPALLAATRRFAERHPDALGRDRSGVLGADLLDDARNLGLFGLTIPESYGGLGLGLGSAAGVIAELARHDRSIATTIGLHNGLGTRALVVDGSNELRSRFLPSLATGERIGAFAATETAAGSDLSAVRTSLRHDGDALRLRGDKAYVTNAGLAGLFTILARAPTDEGAHATTLVVVPRQSDGLSLGREEQKMGLRASSTRALLFDDVRVPHEHRLDSCRQGTAQAHHALEWGRTLMAAGCLGTARAALERSLAHTAERRQFRRSLRSFGAVRAHLCDIAATVATIEAMLLRVGADQASGLSIAGTSAALKVLASELCFDACDRAVQLHGALGFVEDSGVALLARDARITRIFEGANDVLLVRLGSALVAGQGLPRLTGFVTDPRLASAQARLVATVEATRGSLGVTAVGHQRLVTSLARADVALYAAEVCSMEAARSPARSVVLAAATRRLANGVFSALDGVGTALADERADSAVIDALGESAEELVRPS